MRALAADLGVRLEVDDGVKDRLAAEGYDPVFGARPLKRVIQQRIQNPLALRLLEEDVGEQAVVRVSEPAAEGGEMRFEVVAGEEVEVPGG